ncbi:MAG: flagellar protein FlaG [Acidimicrobiales bacterium]
MEIPSHPARPSPPGPVAAAPRVPASVPEGEGGTPAPTTPPAAGRDGIDIVTDTHEATGATITSIVSTETGEVIHQVPPEQVLDLVAFLLEQHRAHNEKRTRHGDH